MVLMMTNERYHSIIDIMSIDDDIGSNQVTLVLCVFIINYPVLLRVDDICVIFYSVW